MLIIILQYNNCQASCHKMGIAAAPIAHIKIIYEHKNEYPFLFSIQAEV